MMTGQPAAVGASNASQAIDTPVSLAGIQLRLAQTAWIAIAMVSIALFVASLPVYFNRLQTLSVTNFMHNPIAVREGLAELGIPLTTFAMMWISVVGLSASVYVGVGILIFWRRPGDRVALLSSAILIMFGVIWPNTLKDLGEAYPILDVPTTLLGALGFAGFLLLFYLFPDGRFVPRWTWPLGILLVAELVVHDLFPRSFLNTDNWPVPLNLISFIFPVTIIYSQIYRYRKVSTPLQRQQTKWVVFSLAAALSSLIAYGGLGTLPAFNAPGAPAALYVLGGIFFFGLAFLLVPISIGFAVLRYRLWDIDPIVNRTIVYGVLTAGVVGIYVLVVGWLGIAFQTKNNLLFSLIATGLVAVLFQPMREHLQRFVNRVMYGERDDPYMVVSRLGQRLEDVIVPEAVLPAIVKTIAEALKLPYAAIVLHQGETSEIAAETGEQCSHLIHLPLTYQHEYIGELLVARRSPEESFSAEERELLESIARQAGVAAHAVRLTEDLQQARERLVEAREEERRRLRRDLHDGLGSQLAAINMELGTLQRSLHEDVDTTRMQIQEIRTEIREAIANIRQIAHNLRPPVLDDLGLRAALQARAERYVSEDLDITLEIPQDLPRLSAAIEVAIYRIVEETLINVVKHARARHCTVSLQISVGAELTIEDDGVGFDNNWTTGVGLLSLRERAEELGGSVEIGAAPGGGTQVKVRLPATRE